ncbi:hypothetical protein NQ790_17590 [Acinetobacter baumannii]|nr:hypothetical protein [Acinetobacter baumannii]
MSDYKFVEEQQVINIETNESDIVSVYLQQEIQNTGSFNVTINNYLFVNSAGEQLACIGKKRYQLKREPYSVFEASLS